MAQKPLPPTSPPNLIRDIPRRIFGRLDNMHEITPLLRTVLTATGVFAMFMAVLLGWAGFLMDGAGKSDAATAFLLMAAAVGVAGWFLLRTVWSK